MTFKDVEALTKETLSKTQVLADLKGEIDGVKKRQKEHDGSSSMWTFLQGKLLALRETRNRLELGEK